MDPYLIVGRCVWSRKHWSYCSVWWPLPKNMLLPKSESMFFFVSDLPYAWLGNKLEDLPIVWGGWGWYISSENEQTRGANNVRGIFSKEKTKNGIMTLLKFQMLLMSVPKLYAVTVKLCQLMIAKINRSKSGFFDWSTLEKIGVLHSENDDEKILFLKKMIYSHHNAHIQTHFVKLNSNISLRSKKIISSSRRSHY